MERFRSEGHAAELSVWTSSDLERESPEGVWRTPSFFCRFRVFILPDLGELKKGARDSVAAYLDSPDPSVVLVLPCSDRYVAKAFSAIPGVLSASLREEQAAAVLTQTSMAAAKAAGKDLSADAAAFLVRWVGLDFGRIEAEIGKLVSFAGDRNEIGYEEIRQVCIASGAVDPFELAEKAVRGEPKEFLSLLRRFAARADQGDYHALVGAVAWVVRKRMSDGRGGLSAQRGGMILAALSDIDRGIKGESRLSPEQFFEIRMLKAVS